MTRRPSEPFQPSDDFTTIRVSKATLAHLEDIQETLAEWMLSSADPDHRRLALALSKDYLIRTIAATFARDYGLSLSQKESE